MSHTENTLTVVGEPQTACQGTKVFEDHLVQKAVEEVNDKLQQRYEHLVANKDEAVAEIKTKLEETLEDSCAEAIEAEMTRRVEAFVKAMNDHPVFKTLNLQIAGPVEVDEYLCSELEIQCTKKQASGLLVRNRLKAYKTVVLGAFGKTHGVGMPIIYCKHSVPGKKVYLLVITS